MLRSMMIFVLALSLSSIVSAQTPLSVDQDTISFWNFDTDTQTVIKDLGPHNIEGVATNTFLAPFPDSSFGNGRYMRDQRSFLSFGNVAKNSPMDLLALNEWSLEFMLNIGGRGDDDRNIFNNGQVSILLTKRRLSATINNGNYESGVITTTIPFDQNIRVAVVYNKPNLQILINGRTQVTTALENKNKKKKSPIYGQPVIIGGSPREAITNYEIGRYHACLTNELGDIQCWGYNEYGQAGTGTHDQYFYYPVNVYGLKNATSISVGEFFSCAISGGKTYCWGVNDENNLGIPGSFFQTNNPLEVTAAAGALELDSGSYHTCAIMGDKTIKCWGRNNQGQLGLGFTSDFAYPTTVPGITNVKQIALGANHTCILNTANQVFCWGANSKGQIAQGTTVQFSAIPQQISSLSGSKKVSLGYEHSCAVTSNDKVKCWGLNTSGQLGIGSQQNTYIPTDAINFENDVVVAIDSGLGNYSCAKVLDGPLKCWGSNVRNQLGQASNVPFLSAPTALPYFSSDVISLKLGGNTTCYQGNSNYVSCFGSNVFGLLGNGDTSVSSQYPNPVLSVRISNIPGYIDDIRVSSVARYLFNVPKLISLTSENVNVNQPNFDFDINSSIQIDGSFLEVKLNGQFVSGLYYQNNKFVGTLSQPLKFGENDLEIKIQDIQGNIGSQHFRVIYSPELDPKKATKVASKGTTSCYLDGEGYVWCWGSNQYGQLGNETFRHSSSPIKNSYLKNIKDIAVSKGSICAVDISNRVWCWGGNNRGQLGQDNSELYQSSYPLEVAFQKPITKVIAGFDNFCAIHTDATMSCWGDNPFNIFNSAIPGAHQLKPVLYPNLSDVKDLSIGIFNLCIIKNDGSLLCNGHNASGQVGDGTFEDKVSLTQLNLTNVRSVAAGIRTTCAVTNTNEGFCWGANPSGLIGSDTDPYQYANPNPKQITITSDISEILLGESTACAVHSDQSLFCWGSNTHGESGNGTLNENINGSDIPNLTLHSGSFTENTICGLNSENEVLCWGGNFNGQAGQPILEVVSTPSLVIQHSTVVKTYSSLLAGQANTCMKNEGQLYCWGNNEQGQLGFRNMNFQEVYPVKMIGHENVVQSSIGFGLLCHINQNSKVLCAGYNNFGQAGKDPSETAVRTLYEVPGLDGMLNVQTGLNSACALKNDGTVWCWGNNELSTLGNGTNISTHIPQQVLNLTNVVEISMHARSSHVCARKTDNSIWCWGSNANGQVSGKPGPDLNTPILVEKFNDASSLSVGGHHTCILSSFGKVTCIGSNFYGQLGIGNNDDNIDFREVALNNIVKVAAGENHVCALDSFKKVSCWGWNNEGQLGNESFEDSKYPVKVMSKVDDLAVGAAHACVLTTDNKLGCWGFNGNAQFGNGNTFSRNVPTFSDIKKF